MKIDIEQMKSGVTLKDILKIEWSPHFNNHPSAEQERNSYFHFQEGTKLSIL